MNHFIIIFSAVLVVVQCEVNQVVVPVAANKLPLISEKLGECAAEIKTTTTFQVMLKKRFNREPINEDEFIMSLYCIVSKCGVVDEHGHIVVDEALTYFPSNVDKDTIKTAFEECNSKSPATDPKDVFVNVFTCCVNTSPALVTLPSN